MNNELEIQRDYIQESNVIREMLSKGTVLIGFFTIEDIELVEKTSKKKKYVKLLIKHCTNKKDNSFCIFDFNMHTMKNIEEFKFQVGDNVFITAYENHTKYGIFKSINTIDLIDLRYELSIVEDTRK